MADLAMAQKRWEMENGVEPVSSADAYFQFDNAGQQAIMAQRPWKQDPGYYKKAKISALALLKMAMHAKSGGNLEIMGMLQGKVQGETFIVVDAFALPVEGTETRVNAQSEANEYMVEFQDAIKRVGRCENICGWYHSHPGYGCWLSGIDTTTQMMQQKFQDPFMAIVVDPHRTLAAGKVELGAFRTYPEGFTPADAPASEYQTIPLEKIEDFGVHCKQYYQLEVSYFKSSVDTHMLEVLWNKYWVNTLSASPLLATRTLVADQVNDIASKLEACETSVSPMGGGIRSGRGNSKQGGNGELHKVTRDCSRMAIEQIKGISSQVIKDLLFNRSLMTEMRSCAQAVKGTEEPALSNTGMAGSSADVAPMET